MEYITIYIAFGTIFSMVMTFIDQMEVEGHLSDNMDNKDRIVNLLLWPILSAIVTYTIIKSFNDKE